MPACAAAAVDAGADWLVYEHDDPADPAASLAHGAGARRVRRRGVTTPDPYSRYRRLVPYWTPTSRQGA